MNRMPVVTQEARGFRRFVLWMARRQYGGVVPGVLRIMLYDLRVGRAVDTLYRHLHLRKSSPLTRLQREMLATVVNGKVGGAPWLGLHTAAVRRLTNDGDLTSEFATTWPEYDLDSKTRALLRYATKLTETPSLLGDSDFALLREAGWDDRGIYEATALTAFFNFSGRMEAASGLPQDDIPEHARFAEGVPDWRWLSTRAAAELVGYLAAEGQEQRSLLSKLGRRKIGKAASDAIVSGRSWTQAVRPLLDHERSKESADASQNV